MKTCGRGGAFVGLLGVVLSVAAVRAEGLPGTNSVAQRLTDTWVAPLLHQLQSNHACGDVLPQGRSTNSNRYALAAMFEACVQQIEVRSLNSVDRIAIHRLQAELASELAVLNAQPFSLEARSNPSPIGAVAAPDHPSHRCPQLLPCHGSVESTAESSEIAYDQTLQLPVSQTPARLQYTRSLPVQLQQPTVGINAEATLGPLGIFGRYRITEDPQPAILNPVGNEHHDHSWVAGVGIQDFLVPEAVLAVTASQPFQTQALNTRPTNFAAFYRLPLTENFTITPTITLIREPLNPSSQPVIEGTVKATFSF